MAGRLTSHVLDTSTGRPAVGLLVHLTRLDDGTLLAERFTNADGRLDEALLDDGEFRTGRYGLNFFVGAFFRKVGVVLPDPAFLDEVPIRFGLPRMLTSMCRCWSRPMGTRPIVAREHH